MKTHKLLALGSLLLAVLLTGCATPKRYDYSAFEQSRPKSILVLPPLNNTPEIEASSAVLSQVTYPLSEAGYYVIPVALSWEVLHENGISQPADAHEIPLEKLHSIFGADAVLYLDVKEYGTVYAIISSASVVTIQGRLVDARSGAQLWDGKATASSAEGRSSGNNLAGILLTALVHQISDSITDKSYAMSATASQRLLSAGQQNGLLYGPRSPKYQTEK